MSDLLEFATHDDERRYQRFVEGGGHLDENQGRLTLTAEIMADYMRAVTEAENAWKADLGSDLANYGLMVSYDRDFTHLSTCFTDAHHNSHAIRLAEGDTDDR